MVGLVTVKNGPKNVFGVMIGVVLSVSLENFI